MEGQFEFPVDLDDAWKWIGCSEKSDAKAVLKNNFEEGVDFLGKGPKTSSGGRPSEWIVLTVDCFKSLVQQPLQLLMGKTFLNGSGLALPLRFGGRFQSFKFKGFRAGRAFSRVVEQRVTDGFINATAMAVAHGKDLSQWLRTKDAYDTFEALACMSGFNPVDLQDSDRVGFSAKKMADYFPRFIVSKRGAPENGGGTWLHPDIALQCAQWCNKTFAIQVSRWVREWLTTGHAPIQPVDVVQELAAWQQRYDLRVYLKDVLRPDLMDATKAWASFPWV